MEDQLLITDKKIIITGGAGFIGSNLVSELVKPNLNNKVVVIDNLSTGHLHNISDLLVTRRGKKEEQKIGNNLVISNNNLTFIKVDITNLALLQNIFQKQKPDHVFHLAAVVSVPRSIQNPIPVHNANVTGTLNVLLAARDNNVKKVIFSSSCAVYGNPPADALPLKETQKVDPQSPYATSKLMGEYYCDIFSKTYNLPTVCLRYFNVYGPRQDPNGEYAAVIPKFIRCVKENKPLIIYGDGKQTRDFVFVDDVVNANILLAEKEETSSKIFNVASGNDISINDLSESILEMNNGFGKNIKILYEDFQPGDIRYSSADISKIKTSGFESVCSLKDGLDKTNNYFSKQIESRDVMVIEN